MEWRGINKISFSAVPETCPKVDKALDVAGNAIKELTGSLREALNEYIELSEERAEEIKSLLQLISELQQEIKYLKEEIKETSIQSER